MIGMLSGKLVLVDGSSIILDVHDVGYKVLVVSQILSKFHIGDTLTLFTHTHVREDALELFGFLSEQDLKLFTQLLSVSGIGPKTAMGIFSIGTKEEIVGAISKADVAFFMGVPRLGRKNAQKIIIELKNKLGSGEELDLSDGTADEKEIISVLTSMGFSEKEAKQAIQGIGEGSVEEKIKFALRKLGR